MATFIGALEGQKIEVFFKVDEFGYDWQVNL